MYVKICGITRAEDRDAALAAGASALGFVAYPRSRRFVTPKRVCQLVQGISRLIDLVGVFVDPDLETVESYCRAGITVVQLHGHETEAFARQAASLGRVWKALSLQRREQLATFRDYPAERFLIDACVVGSPGGTGHLADWELAAEAVSLLPRDVLLAGGLTAANVCSALERVRPFGLDLSSGVELSPGVKDPEKIRGFMAAITASPWR